MQVIANAKINAGLDILGKRSDGYHDINTVFIEIPIFDILELELNDNSVINVDCDDSEIPSGKNNLVYRAVKMLFEDFHISKGLDIYIKKNIPSGAGLGGGSSDAAAALKAVNILFGLNLSDDELITYASKLGADVAFFIKGGAAYASGIGDVLTFFKISKLFPMIIAVPKISVSTPMAYAAADRSELLHFDIRELSRHLFTGNLEGICEKAGNSFEKPIFRIFPVIKKIRDDLIFSGAKTAVMTGSGSAVYSIFDDDEILFKAYRSLEKKVKDVKLFVIGERHEK